MTVAAVADADADGHCCRYIRICKYRHVIGRSFGPGHFRLARANSALLSTVADLNGGGRRRDAESFPFLFAMSMCEVSSRR